jgi:polyribonucleotide nucleotidyltransferase
MVNLTRSAISSARRQDFKGSLKRPAKIDIEDDGRVFIAAVGQTAGAKAIQIIDT